MFEGNVDKHRVAGHGGQAQGRDGNRLLLSTDDPLSPVTIVETYGLGWPIESMFNQLEQRWGLKAWGFCAGQGRNDFFNVADLVILEAILERLMPY